MTPSYVGLLKKLLTLPTNTQKLVHARQLSVKAAAALTELTPEEQQKALESVPEPTPSQVEIAPVPPTATGEKLSSRVVKAVRAAKIDKGGKQARSLAEVRKFFEGLTEKVQVKALAEMMLKFIQGRLTDKTMENKLTDLFTMQQGGKEAPVQVQEAKTSTVAQDQIQPVSKANPSEAA